LVYNLLFILFFIFFESLFHVFLFLYVEVFVFFYPNVVLIFIFFDLNKIFIVLLSPDANNTNEDKMMLATRKLTSIVMISASLALFGCSDDDNDSDNAPVLDIVETATDAEGFSTLVAAVSAANLVATLQDDGPFTVFAPTDEAFTNYLEANDLSADQLLESEGLADILTYHVLASEVLAEDAVAVANSDENIVYTLNGQGLALSRSGEDLYINLSKVISPDNLASNGVIHGIDAVLELPAERDEEVTASIVDIASGNADFSKLVGFLSDADLVTALQGDGPFTVFAPTNDAFSKIPEATLDGLSLEQLTAILKQHVVSGEVDSISAFALNGDSADTLAGDDISIDIVDGKLMVQGAMVVSTDIYATNGVIHVIDTVITETLE
jgi:uncharacterized surface protein with fasciclin (FAS1) repeats